MKPANVAQAKSRVIVDQGVILNRISALMAPLPAWWRSRLPRQPCLVFSAADLDAIAFSASFGPTDPKTSPKGWIGWLKLRILLWVCSEAERPMSVFHQKNGTEHHYPVSKHREFALERTRHRLLPG